MKRTMSITIQKTLISSAAALTVWAMAGMPAAACNFKPGRGPVGVVGLSQQMALAMRMMGGVAPQSDQPEARAKAKSDPSIVGLWLGTVYIDGQEAFHGFETFSSDGNEVLVDDSAPATDNVCVGTWVQTGPLTYRLKHPSWVFDTNGNLTGTVLIGEEIKLDADGNGYSASVVIAAFDTQGNSLGKQTATLKATRITAD